jgi:hypothetical protein
VYGNSVPINPHSADTKANLGIKNLEKEKPEKIA